MSLILHRCRVCGHPDYFNGRDPVRRGVKIRTNCTTERCPCARGRCDWGPSEAAPTFDKNGQTIEEVVPPGGQTGPLRVQSTVPCICEQCRTLYTELTGEPAPVYHTQEEVAV